MDSWQSRTPATCLAALLRQAHLHLLQSVWYFLMVSKGIYNIYIYIYVYNVYWTYIFFSGATKGSHRRLGRGTACALAAGALSCAVGIAAPGLSRKNTQLFKADLLTFWFPFGFQFLVEVPKGDHLLFAGPLGK